MAIHAASRPMPHNNCLRVTSMTLGYSSYSPLDTRDIHWQLCYPTFCWQHCRGKALIARCPGSAYTWRMARKLQSASISFGLVTTPADLYTATSAESISFNQIHGMCGSRIKQQLYCPVYNRVVERSEVVKGYESGSVRLTSQKELCVYRADAQRGEK
jgi:hypothetical protein